MDIEELISELIEEEEELGEEEALAEVFKLANKLIKLLNEIKSYEIKEAASLTIIKELVEDDEILKGLATKMLQDMSYGMEDNYMS